MVSMPACYTARDSDSVDVNPLVANPRYWLWFGGADVDRAALYTPESLAQEFALRFVALNLDAKKANPKVRSKTTTRTIADRAGAEQNDPKGGKAATKKRTEHRRHLTTYLLISTTN